MSYEDKRKNTMIRNMSISEAVQKKVDEENLKKLYIRRITESFYKKGYTSQEATLEEVYESLNGLVNRFVTEGFDADKLLLAIRRGFEQREKENNKGKSR